MHGGSGGKGDMGARGMRGPGEGAGGGAHIEKGLVAFWDVWRQGDKESVCLLLVETRGWHVEFFCGAFHMA